MNKPVPNCQLYCAPAPPWQDKRCSYRRSELLLSAFAIDAANTKRQTKFPVSETEGERGRCCSSFTTYPIALARATTQSEAAAAAAANLYCKLFVCLAVEPDDVCCILLLLLRLFAGCFIKYISFNLRRLSGASSRTIGDNCSIILPLQKERKGSFDGTCT